ncbi:MAG: hypothetical protein EOM22_08810 [Gammaproteobacteria bacterium]|nr:hypothetical protein [Gammaproteobacteria bacterium]
MTLSDIIKAAIREAGGDGLCYDDIECGCGVDDLAPCGSPDINRCEIAIMQTIDGDDWYMPLPIAEEKP